MLQLLLYAAKLHIIFIKTCTGLIVSTFLDVTFSLGEFAVRK